MIDLHMHTTASDGTLAPAALVDRAHAIGIRTMSVTDHDTMAGVPEAAAAAAGRGIELLPGIEITAVADGRDVHMLAYFLDPAPARLDRFLADQREDRVRRAREMGEKLAALAVPIPIEGLIEKASAAGRAVARPVVARALVEAGHCATPQEAFDRWLADGGPAYVARRGASPAEVVRLVAEAGGLVSLAHPGLLRRDELIPGLAESGLGAIEAFHSDHDAAAEARYQRLADRLGLAVSGGSDFHGERHHRAKSFGRVGLPPVRYETLVERVRRADAAAGPAAAAAEPA
ncbi:MAG: PHP domain-containing protein [Acidobacteria bacterium]|nr:PHP domain-containing protein [Acidobacteriota bacterium]